MSWDIAFFEYCLQVPANRWGNSVYSAAQLKIIQEIITLSVFVVFAMLYLHEKIRVELRRGVRVHPGGGGVRVLAEGLRVRSGIRTI